jgi:hypothetical protein
VESGGLNDSNVRSRLSVLKTWTRNRLSDEQMTGVLEYIAQHPEQVEEEYQDVLRQAEASRAYWEERNRERFLAISKQPPSPGKEALYEKLKKRKSELGMS